MNHMLGIMIHTNDVLQDARGKTSIDRKKQVMRSLGVLIERVGPTCSFVAPQVRCFLFTFIIELNSLVDHGHAANYVGNPGIS